MVSHNSFLAICGEGFLSICGSDFETLKILWRLQVAHHVSRGGALPTLVTEGMSHSRSFTVGPHRVTKVVAPSDPTTRNSASFLTGSSFRRMNCAFHVVLFLSRHGDRDHAVEPPRHSTRGQGEISNPRDPPSQLLRSKKTCLRHLALSATACPTNVSACLTKTVGVHSLALLLTGPRFTPVSRHTHEKSSRGPLRTASAGL